MDLKDFDAKYYGPGIMVKDYGKKIMVLGGFKIILFKQLVYTYTVLSFFFINVFFYFICK